MLAVNAQEAALHALAHKPARTTAVAVTDGYRLRQYQFGDERALARLLATEGWHIEENVQYFLDRVVPFGLVFAIRETTDEIVGTASAVHNPNGGHYHFPFGGEIGYVAVRLEHRGGGLGRALTRQPSADCFRPDAPASVWLLRTTDSRR